MNYRSKPYTITAFKFNIPFVQHEIKWYWELVKTGKVATTYNGQDSYITVYSNNGNIEKAYVGDWVCLNDQGKLFVIDGETFEKCYEVEENDNDNRF